MERHVRLIDRVQEQTGGSTRHDLLAIGARSAEFLGWLYQDLGDAYRATTPGPLPSR
ncbi:hypothetical protein [Kitasatospora sp. GP82]|uniref:hypothetical protein n=1 Tax=Kitasatospora sp. GP82 TaxID=3035089 RepID=UPI00247478E6|nr:hypothetical protein [Kitasatospora sp. GP82]MDH6130401.1 hypothetical protein [Kitasatospora sp. GP82]